MIRTDLDLLERTDVLVIGGGNAALCAAISARLAGASVLVLEAAPHFYRGGNTRHTRNMRCAHDSATTILTGPYTEDEFWEDLKRVTQGHTDEELARFMIAESREMLTWIVAQGARFQPSLGGSGFEANIEWLKEGWGEIAENFLIRGTPYNRGTVLRMLIDHQVQQIGDVTQCDAVAIDARAPKFDGGIITRLDCVIYGIVVNMNCERFYDEGEDIRPKRYAIWGRFSPRSRTAYIVFDASSLSLFMPSLFPPIKADSIAELATLLELDPRKLSATVTSFNEAVQPGTFDAAAPHAGHGPDPGAAHRHRLRTVHYLAVRQVCPRLLSLRGAGALR